MQIRRTNEELAAEIKSGNQELMAQLWRQCYGFIRLQAAKWAQAWEKRPDIDIDDFIQGAYFALNKAVQAYDNDRGAFLNFLSFYLKTEFSKVAGVRSSRTEPLNIAMSMDAPAYNDLDNDTTIGDTIAADDSSFEDIENDIFNAQLSDALSCAMDDLPEKQRNAVEMNYLKGHTYSEIAERLGCSVAYSGQLVKDGLKGMRRGKHAPTLAELLWGEKNFYAGTGYAAWNESRSSVQERLLIWQENMMQRYGSEDSKAAKIRYCISVLGMDQNEANRLFPA